MALILINNLDHHAYCLIGGDLSLQKLVAELEKVHKISAKGNTDFYNKSFVNFTIDDVRDLISFQEIRPVHESGKKILIIKADNINLEAQNALLKTFEEPAGYAHFFLIVPSRHLLIPTVQSRLSFVEVDSDNPSNFVDDGFSVTFLKSTPAKRLETVKKIVDDIADEKLPKRYAIEFVNSLEKALMQGSGKNGAGVKNNMKSLEAIQIARKYLNDRAPSVKMLLEYVVLNV